jgi:hypothetical protein
MIRLMERIFQGRVCEVARWDDSVSVLLLICSSKNISAIRVTFLFLQDVFDVVFIHF